MKSNKRFTTVLPALMLGLLLIFSAAADAAVAISGGDGFDPAVAVRRDNPLLTDSVQALSSPTLAQSTTVGFAGHQWVVIGWNGYGVASAANTATLLLANADINKPESSIFNPSTNYVNSYAGSTLYDSITSFYNSLPAVEKGCIAPRDLTGGSELYSYSSTLSTINVANYSSAAGNASVTQYTNL